MTICFLRHADADWPDWDKPDDERPLTRRGRKQTERMAKFLGRIQFAPNAILTSPLPRAAQTAEIVAKRLCVAAQTEPALAPGFKFEALHKLVEKSPAESVLVVGHEPDFSRAIKALTSGEVKLTTAGVALVETDQGCKSGRLLWLLPPRIAGNN
ncbi:MAG: phosphohistidine phosphatase SixA [Chthoniobacterales bacterium]